MRWESKLYGFKEAPGTVDPVVFKYPARSSSSVILVVSCALLWGAWTLVRWRPSILVVTAPLIALIGIVGVGYAIWSLLVVRRIEVHRSARKLLEIRRVPIKGETSKVHDFGDIRRISVTRGIGAESGEIRDVIVVELENGDHVDFGNHSGDVGSRLAARLHELTGASVESPS